MKAMRDKNILVLMTDGLASEAVVQQAVMIDAT
jgi:hypothetical protein